MHQFKNFNESNNINDNNDDIKNNSKFNRN